MKITAVTSSPSKKGNTRKLALTALKGAEENGAETREIFLADYKIEFCKGCMSCMKTGKCVIKDDFEILKLQLLESDGIILASPTYGLDINARMKNFIVDRLGMLNAYTSGLGGKYFAGFSTAGGIGASKVAKKLAYEFASGIFKKSYVSGYHGITLGNKDYKVEPTESYPKSLKKAYQIGKKMTDDIQKEKKYKLQNLFSNLMMNILIKRLMIKNIQKNKSDTLKAVYEDLKKRKLISF